MTVDQFGRRKQMTVDQYRRHNTAVEKRVAEFFNQPTVPTLEEAIEMVKAAGYRVSKPRAKVNNHRHGLNALGKPISALYDPNYKLKTPLTSIGRLRGPQNFPWAKDK